MGYHPPQDIDPAARALIRHKVRWLVGHYGFNRSDADDLEQELALQAHVARARYDPARGTRTKLFHKVLSNRVCEIVEHRSLPEARLAARAPIKRPARH